MKVRKSTMALWILFLLGMIFMNGCDPPVTVETPIPTLDIAVIVETVVATVVTTQPTSDATATYAAIATEIAVTQTAQAESTAKPTEGAKGPDPLTPTPTPTATPIPTPKPEAVVNTELLNLRSGPSVVYGVLAVLERGDSLTVMGRDLEGDWLRVITPNGQEGWAARSLLVNVDVAGVPVFQAPPTPTQMYTPTPVVTPTPELLPPPIPLEPENGASFIGEPVLLKWQWDRPRATNEVFSVRVRREGETRVCHHAQAKDLEYKGSLTYCTAGTHYWSVALVRDLDPGLPEEDMNRWQDLSEASEERWFYYVPGEEPWTWPMPDIEETEPGPGPGPRPGDED